MQYVGIDWAYRRAAWCAKQADGTIFGEGFVPADEDGLARLVIELGPEVRACLEMMSGAVWVRDRLAGGVYVLWAAAYFVAFWSITGQTPGARVMQVRLVTPAGGKVRPYRALLRWIGMNVAMVPLPWGYLPIPFKRLGFPDWLAHTRVIAVKQLSVAEALQENKRPTRDNSAPPSSHADREITDDRGP